MDHSQTMMDGVGFLFTDKKQIILCQWDKNRPHGVTYIYFEGDFTIYIFKLGVQQSQVLTVLNKQQFVIQKKNILPDAGYLKNRVVTGLLNEDGKV